MLVDLIGIETIFTLLMENGHQLKFSYMPANTAFMVESTSCNIRGIRRTATVFLSLIWVPLKSSEPKDRLGNAANSGKP